LLQKEWFPINYSDDFYNRLINGTAVGYMAEATIVPEEGKEMAVVVGAVVFEFTTEDEDLRSSWYSRMFAGDFNSIYIMTLGVID
jgi:hypothetical protein